MFQKIYDELTSQFDNLNIVDSHEHLVLESDRVAQNVSFTDLFSHYCADDFLSSGMPGSDVERMYHPGTPLDEKWKLFSPFYKLIKNGTYQRSARIAMEKFYGVADLNTLDDAVLVSERMKNRNKTGLYETVLKDACHFEKCMLFSNLHSDNPLFDTVWRVDDFTEINSIDALQALAGELSGIYTNLNDYENALGEYTKKLKDRGVKGIKFTMAYNRDLDFTPPAFSEAETVYHKIFKESFFMNHASIGYSEARPLQNYLVNAFARFAAEYEIPMVFHTGMQTGAGNLIDTARPERLSGFINIHKNTKFVILHAGVPWTREAIILTKYYPNVFLDLAWLHIISPKIADDTIQTFVDFAPRNKLLGFGGDYLVVEPVYGHLMIAKDNIARALANRVMDGALSAKDALEWQKSMLVDNPKTVYHL